MPVASITGSVRPKLPVISTTLAVAVSGACAAALKTAPMPTTAKTAGAPTPGPKRCSTMTPKAMPAAAPVKSEGANTPPEPPIERVRLVATTLPTMSTTRSHRTTWPATI